VWRGSADPIASAHRHVHAISGMSVRVWRLPGSPDVGIVMAAGAVQVNYATGQELRPKGLELVPGRELAAWPRPGFARELQASGSGSPIRFRDAAGIVWERDQRGLPTEDAVLV
jgi:hypothetical protein